MKEGASMLTFQKDMIEEDVTHFSRVLAQLKNIDDKQSISKKVQEAMLEYQSVVARYHGDVQKYTKKNTLKQVAYHQETRTESENTKVAAKNLFDVVQFGLIIDRGN
uniref:Uncharacterized protein n=1 Tax=Globisporangium ultimum (strain ATCC 200006 / CBS 805.95 / DAOM BR144) TaxID=431595 RepID=K3WUX4_GLOUD